MGRWDRDIEIRPYYPSLAEQEVKHPWSEYSSCFHGKGNKIYCKGRRRKIGYLDDCPCPCHRFEEKKP